MFKINSITCIFITLIFVISSVLYYVNKNNKYTEDAFVNKATYHMKNENYFQAIRYYKKLISMGSKDERNYINEAKALIITGNYDTAIKHLHDMEDKNLVSCDMYYLLAYSYFLKAKNIDKTTDFSLAKKYLKQSLGLDSRNKDAYKLLGTIYEINCEFEHARKWYRKALFEDIDNSFEFYGLIANTYFKEKRYDNALKYYNRAIDNNKNYISSYCNIAEIYRIQNNFYRSEIYYKKAIDIAPEYVYPYYKIGNLYFIQQEYENAVKWYKKALEIEPQESVINYYIGLSYKRLNMIKEAMEHLKLAAYCGNDKAVDELRKYLGKF